MDSDSIGDRLKDIQICESDNVENSKESMEENVPKILSAEIHDVFHIFASMLDVKSFMKLAMTSKKMYKRCTEDKSIKINVDMNRLDVSNERGSVEFAFSFPSILHRHRDGFVASLRKLPCKVNLGTLAISGYLNPEVSVVHEAQRYMNEIRVNKIHDLAIRLSTDDEGWETIFAMIKDFVVEAVSVHCEFQEDILRSFLQMNLEILKYYGPVPVDFLLEIDSAIQKISFPDVNRISKEQFMGILVKIQCRSLHRVTVHPEAVNWDEFHALPFDHEGSLPDDRPLLFEKITRDEGHYYDYGYGYHDGRVLFREYWFLHWHGGVTKCVVDHRLKIFKCDPWEYPWILRKEEDILKDLSQKRPKILCSANQFRTFCASFTMIDRSQEGSLPNDRPLYFKTSEKKFWMLGEDDNLMECAWNGGFATWKSYNRRYVEIYKHPALAKYIFWKVVRQVEEGSDFTFYCKGMEEFNNWFEDFEKLEFEYSGVLPSARPLVFERASSEKKALRVVLFDERLLQCEYYYHNVSIKLCHYLNLPLVLFSAKYVLEMLQDPCPRNLHVNVHYEESLGGFSQFKRSSLVLQKRIVISELVSDEFWYWMDDVKLVRKVAWKEGGLSLVGGDLRGSPSGFMKQIFKYYAETEGSTSFTLELEEFNSCLEQFTVLPFYYSGPITYDSPIAFVKNEIRHTCCRSEVKCQCSEVTIFVLSLWNGTRFTKCSWGIYMHKQKEVHFGIPLNDMPPALKAKEYLKFLSQVKCDKSSRFEWFGNAEDFRVYLDDYMKLPFDHEGPLPEERPLLFENNKYSSSQFLIRADGTIIKCVLSCSSVELSSSTSYDYHVPPALKNLF